MLSLSIISCNSGGSSGIINPPGGVVGGGGGGGGNNITLNQANPTVNPTVVFNHTALCEFANGLFDGTNYFIAGNDHPTGANANPNVYVYKLDNAFNNANPPLTIDFNNGTSTAQLGNLYIDQDTNNVYVLGSTLNGTDSDLFIAKVVKNTNTLDNTFSSGSPIQGVVVLDRGNNETPGGLLIDAANNVGYAAGYNNQRKVVIFKFDTSNGNLINAFGTNGYAEIDPDNNNNTADMATDILTDGTNLIIVGEQTDTTTGTTNLILFKVDPTNGQLVSNSLITIAPPSGQMFLAAPLDAAISNNKVYLGANTQPANDSILAVFDLSNNSANYYLLKDQNNNNLKINIHDLELDGTTLYISGTFINGSNNNLAYIKINTTNLSGTYYINSTVTDNIIWGNIPTANSLILLGGDSNGNEFRLIPINNP